MDRLNFVIALHDTLRAEIPEADYPKLSTLGGCVDYLAAAAARCAAPRGHASPGRGRQRGSGA